MACVILPSETARLVYGYLVKENLNDIALQFLERSPYLMDCCQIVKSGYQFNTKLMGKEMQDLLQEYSVIHNLANKKVNLLCKTSLLYKRIKLKCESLPEILELILFWKYRHSRQDKGDQLVISEKSIKNLSGSFSGSGATSDIKANNDVLSNQKVGGLSTSLSNGNCSSGYFGNSSEPNIALTSDNESDLTRCENFKMKLSSETCIKDKDSIENDINPAGSIEVMQEMNDCTSRERTSENVPVQMPDQYQTNNSENICNGDNVQTVITNSENETCNVSVSNSEMPDLCLSASVLNMDVDVQQKNSGTNEVINQPQESTQTNNDFSNQIKIVRIEKETQSENPIVSAYSVNGNPTDRNITLEDGSVVYVSPELGNVAIDQERNQIIVIPIDYYKAQNEVQNRIEMNTVSEIQQKNDYHNQNEMIKNQEKNNILYENAEQNGETQMNQFYSEGMHKTAAVDDNIMTESDFLANKHLMFNMEKNFTRKPETQLQAQPPAGGEITREIAPLQTVTAPLIVLSEANLQTAKSFPRYRSILPKKKTPVPSVVLVQPLLESTQSLLKRAPPKSKPIRKNEKIVKGKKKVPLIQMNETKNNKEMKEETQETFNMPSIKTPVPDKSNKDESEIVILETAEPETAQNVSTKVQNDEKENLKKSEKKKVETPVFVTRRNSKRLSLSTPRRRSHVRALEFETPPKTKEPKKSRTSPKTKVEQVAVERKSVRNTLFKSPIPETSLKSPEAVNGTKKDASKNDSSQDMGVVPLNELSIPIATRSPNTKLSDAWENLTGVGCVIGQSGNSTATASKKMWDADLRCFLGRNDQEPVVTEKKRIRKPEKVQKDNRKNVKKKNVATKKSKSVPSMVSPSKMSLTSKRNTYSINGNEEGSPLRSLLDDLKIVTPFKDIETICPTEETPLTKLLRENINTIDIDLSMINTPSFPPTPSILITPDLDDVSLIGTNYYSPSKDFSKDKMVKITDYFRVEGEKVSKKDTKEAHEKVIDDLVSKAKEIIGIGKESQEDCSMKRRPSGKILSMVKIQMLTQCDKKLCENIPINEEATFPNGSANQSQSICNLSEEVTKPDLKEELEEKKKRALKKIKVVKENLSGARNKVVKRTRKRKRSGLSSSSSSGKKPRRSRSEGLHDTATDEKHNSWSEEERKHTGVFHSTPYDSKKHGKFEKPESEKKENDETLSDIRQELPPYPDNDDAHPELSEKSRKKFHYVRHFLEVEEIAKFLSEYNETNPPKLYLKPSFRRFFQVFYKWLKHPHKHELAASTKTKLLLHKYLVAFDKINVGVNFRSKKLRKSDAKESTKKLETEGRNASGEKAHKSDEETTEWKNRRGTAEKKKDEEAEDGLVSILPLKKRKQNVQQVDAKSVTSQVVTPSNKSDSTENVSQTQNFLQDIDVDRFLSQIHGQSNR